MKCSSCESEFTDGVQCQGCKRDFDFQCADIRENNYRRLGKGRPAWRCKDCRVPPSSSTVTLEAVMNEIQNIKIKLTPLELIVTDVKDLKSDLTKLSDSLKSLHTTTEKHGSLIANMETRIKTLESQQSCVPDLMTSIDFTSKEVEDLKNTIVSTQAESTKYKQLKDTLCDVQSRISGLQYELNTQHQHDRLLNIEITGVPESKGEILSNLLVKLAGIMNINIAPSDIDNINRVEPRQIVPGRPRSIICKLRTRMLKDSLIAGIRKRRGLTSTDLGFSGTSSSIFVNEHLTVLNKNLLKTAREVAKEKGYKYVWTKNCRIFMRKNDVGPPLLIKTPEDLKRKVV